MDGQLSFATLDYAGKKKRTKRDAFWPRWQRQVPWSVLEDSDRAALSEGVVLKAVVERFRSP